MKDHRFLDETLTKSIRRAISLCLVLALLAGTPGLTVASAYESHDHDGTVDAEPEHDHQQRSLLCRKRSRSSSLRSCPRAARCCIPAPVVKTLSGRWMMRAR